MDRLNAMQTFVKVVESGSFSAAAKQLGTPLPTVSRNVAELEAHLGATLLRRTTRRLELTEIGADYLRSCKTILDQVGEAEHIASGEYRSPKGSLHVTASILFGRIHLIPVLADFLKAYPEIDVRLSLTDRPINFIEENLDFALRMGHLNDSNLMSLRLGESRVVTCASPLYLDERGTPEDLKGLANHTCITFEGLAATPLSFWTFNKGKRDIPVTIHSRLSVSTMEAAIHASLCGLGITRTLCYPILDHLKSGALRTMLTDYEPPALPIHLLYPSQASLPLKMRAFIDFVVPRLKNILITGEDSGRT